MIQIGQKIDDFEFEVYQNEEIKKDKLSSFQGKWLVLLFYPADFTFICPTELEEAAEYYGEFKKEATGAAGGTFLAWQFTLHNGEA